MRRLVDANVVLRYILNDSAELSEKSRQIIDQSIVEIPVEVLSEVVHVLSSVYDADRKDIGFELIGLFMKTPCVIQNRKAILKGLEIYAENNLDFVDCLLAGYRCVEGVVIDTFDKKLLKLLERL